MKAIVFAASFALFGTACGNGSNHDDPGGDDGPSDPGGDDDVPMPPRIAIRTGEAPELIAYREETTPTWKVPTSTGPGTYEIEVTGPYRVVIACGGARRFLLISQYARTPADERSIEHLCISSTFPFHVTGEMLQEGEVFLGNFGEGASPAPWTFDLGAAAGTFDFAIFFGSLTTGLEQVAIHRDLVVTGDMQLATIDAAQEHPVALAEIALSAPNLDPDEELTANVFAELGHTFVGLESIEQGAMGWNVRALPVSVLRPTDTQEVNLMASTPMPDDAVQRRSRSITHPLRAGGPTSIMLMEPLGPAAFQATADRLVATWGSLPSYDELLVARTSFAEDFSKFLFHEALLTRAFVDATGITSTALDFSDVPGFKPEWRHDPLREQVLSLDVSAHTSSDDLASSGVSETLAAPEPSGPNVARTRVDAQHVLEVVEQQRVRARRLRAMGAPADAR